MVLHSRTKYRTKAYNISLILNKEVPVFREKQGLFVFYRKILKWNYAIFPFAISSCKYEYTYLGDWK